MSLGLHNLFEIIVTIVFSLIGWFLQRLRKVMDRLVEQIIVVGKDYITRAESSTAVAALWESVRYLERERGKE